MTLSQQEAVKTKTNVNFVLQGKGGVGKSMVASILVQYFRARSRTVHPIDTDPVNQTLHQYEKLGASHLELMREGSIDTRQFDSLMEQILTNPGDYVIDNGASTFVPLWHYMVDNQVLALLKQRDCKVFIHTVITGGQALLDTISGFQSLADATQDRTLVLWLNEYFGPVVNEKKTHFLESDLFAQNKEKIVGTIGIKQRNPDTFGRDMQEMLAQKLTFQEACANGHFQIMAKQRLTQVQRELFDQLDTIQFA